MHQLWLRYALIVVAIRLVSPNSRSTNGIDTTATGTTVLTGLQGSIDSVVRSVSDSASWRISPSNPSAATVQFIFTAINMVRKLTSYYDFHRSWLSYLRRRWYQVSDSLSANCTVIMVFVQLQAELQIYDASLEGDGVFVFSCASCGSLLPPPFSSSTGSVGISVKGVPGDDVLLVAVRSDQLPSNDLWFHR